MAPPLLLDWVTELLKKVVLVMVAVALLGGLPGEPVKIAPPSAEVLPEKVLAVTVKVPKLAMAPP